MNKYQEEGTEKIPFHKNAIYGHLFQGNAVFDLPQSLGMLYMKFHRESGKVMQHWTEQRMVVYVVTQRAILLLGFPLTEAMTHERYYESVRDGKHIRNREQRNMMLMFHLLGLNARIVVHTTDTGSQPAVLQVAKLFSLVRRHGGPIKSAGVMGIDREGVVGTSDYLFPVTYDALGLGLYKELGVSPKPWLATKIRYVDQAFLAWVDRSPKRVLRLSIADEIFVTWEEGSELEYPGVSNCVGQFNQISLADIRRQGEEEDECEMDVDNEEIEGIESTQDT